VRCTLLSGPQTVCGTLCFVLRASCFVLRGLRAACCSTRSIRRRKVKNRHTFHRSLAPDALSNDQPLTLAANLHLQLSLTLATRPHLQLTTSPNSPNGHCLASPSASPDGRPSQCLWGSPSAKLACSAANLPPATLSGLVAVQAQRSWSPKRGRPAPEKPPAYNQLPDRGTWRPFGPLPLCLNTAPASARPGRLRGQWAKGRALGGPLGWPNEG